MPKEEWGTKRMCPHCGARFSPPLRLRTAAVPGDLPADLSNSRPIPPVRPASPVSILDFALLAL